MNTLTYAWKAALYGGLGGLLLGLRGFIAGVDIAEGFLWFLGLGLFLAVAMFVVAFLWGLVKNLASRNKVS